MGNTNGPRLNFVVLAMEHVHCWMLYACAKQRRDEELIRQSAARLAKNVDDCCAELNARLPGAALLARNRFHHSAAVEMLLLENLPVALAELEDCHRILARNLSIVCSSAQPWEALWKEQREAMVAFVQHLQSGTSDEQRCNKAAKALGTAFDSVLRVAHAPDLLV